MDNLIVCSTGVGCLFLCEILPQGWPEATPLGIIAVVVYFFLTKFDKKMDTLLDRTEKLEDFVDNQKEKEEKRNAQ